MLIKNPMMMMMMMSNGLMLFITFLHLVTDKYSNTSVVMYENVH